MNKTQNSPLHQHLGLNGKPGGSPHPLHAKHNNPVTRLAHNATVKVMPALRELKRSLIQRLTPNQQRIAGIPARCRTS